MYTSHVESKLHIWHPCRLKTQSNSLRYRLLRCRQVVHSAGRLHGSHFRSSRWRAGFIWNVFECNVSQDHSAFRKTLVTPSDDGCVDVFSRNYQWPIAYAPPDMRLERCKVRKRRSILCMGAASSRFGMLFKGYGSAFTAAIYIQERLTSGGSLQSKRHRGGASYSDVAAESAALRGPYPA